MKTRAEIIKSNIFTYFNLIFAVLAALLIFAGSWKSLTFLPVVIANIVIGIVQELRAKKVLDELTVMNAPTARVERGGQVTEIPVEELVRGDIVVFSAGDQICADAEVESGELYVNEALLTGESEEIKKLPGDPLLSGSFAVSGQCRAKLTAVGQESYASQLEQRARTGIGIEQSEMIKQLGRLVKAVGIIIIPVGIVLFVQQHLFAGLGVSESIVAMVAALIGMIPEGLFLLTSVALAVSMIRLAEQGVMLHDMKSIETLARVDVLCVDKTGTITDEQMRVSQVVPLGDAASGAAEGAGAVPQDRLETLISDFLAAMPEGNITDKALRAYFSRPSGAAAEKVVPFSSASKCSSAVICGWKYVLGAPEFVLKDAWQAHRGAIEPWTQSGSRVLLFARQKGAESLTEAIVGQTAAGGVQQTAGPEPLALILLENHVRDNAPQTFRYFAEQDVQIKVISGDDPATVSKAAAKAQIPGAENMIDARLLDSEEKISRAVNEYTVFGRVTPDQKLTIIKSLKAAGHTVGMTGDGVNDVLALKEADCSVAMASGASAAVHASKMVLLNSDFAAMPGVVLEGRRVVNNIQRSASLFLVKNVFSLITALFSMIFAAKYPIIPSQMTLIAAFTIGVPGFFLALAPCKDRIKGSFMRNVLSRALPGGIADAAAVIIFSGIARAKGLPQSEIAAGCTLILAVIGIVVLMHICRPINLARAVLIAGCALGMAAVCIIMPGIFEIVPISRQALVLIAVICAAAAAALHFSMKQK